MKYSLIVPVFRQWQMLPKLLEQLAAQTISNDEFEVIVVNNNCPDFSAPNQMPAHFRIETCAVPGSYAARNVGAKNAKGHWLVFTDADCLPEIDWLQKLDEAIDQNNNVDLFAGEINMFRASGRPTVFETFDMVRGIPQQRYVRHGYAATANLAVRKDVFWAVSGFDDSRLSGGDAAFCRKAIAAGNELTFVKEMLVRHPARSSWSQCVTKVRRVKGGQIKNGSFSRRLALGLRTFIPPLRGALHFLRANEHAPSDRIMATSVLFMLWFVEMGEVLRLLVGGRPERS